MKILLLVTVSLGLYAESVDDLAALNAIKAVLSVTTSGVTFLAYSERVLDARVKTDQVPTLAPKLKLALEYYEVSSSAWGLKLGPDTKAFQRSVEVGRKLDSEPFKACKAVMELTSSVDASFKKKPPPADQRYSTLANLLAQRPNLLWPCAANLVREFDRQHK
jgi:hypothetical protein